MTELQETEQQTDELQTDELQAWKAVSGQSLPALKLVACPGDKKKQN